jgi:hypothetical protein
VVGVNLPGTIPELIKDSRSTSIPFNGVPLLTSMVISRGKQSAGPYLWAGHGPQSKGVGQLQ